MAAEHMEGIFTFAAIDCDDQVNRGLCQEFGIEGFPTLKYMKPYHGKVDAQGIRLYCYVDGQIIVVHGQQRA